MQLEVRSVIGEILHSLSIPLLLRINIRITSQLLQPDQMQEKDSEVWPVKLRNSSFRLQSIVYKVYLETRLVDYYHHRSNQCSGDLSARS